MKADASLRRDADGVRWRDSMPIVLRPTGSDVVHLVQAAGGPLGGDELRLDVEVAAGQRLRIDSVAATVVQPGVSGAPARWLVELDLAAGADLRWTPQPTVICHGADYRAEIRAELAGDARLVARELVLLGRSGETGGRYRGALAVNVDGKPLLRNESILDGADPELSGPAGAGGHRVLGTLLVAGADTDAPRQPCRVEPGLLAATLPLDGPGYLVLVLGSTAAAVGAALDTALVQQAAAQG